MLLNFDQLVTKYGLNIEGIIHIGAHYGNENDAYVKHNIKNKMFFEPLPHTFKILQEKVKDGVLINVALGNENKKIEMYVEYDNQSQSSSMLKPKVHAQQYPHIRFNDKIEVDMLRLDDIDFDRNLYNFINIDVQGYELEVFKGAEKTLHNIDYIMSEVNRAELYENCVLVDQLDTFLDKYGFKRVVTTWDGGSWGDCLYIKIK